MAVDLEADSKPLTAVVATDATTQPLLESIREEYPHGYWGMLVDFMFDHRRYFYFQNRKRLAAQRTIIAHHVGAFDSKQEQLAYLATEADTPDGFPYCLLEEAARRSETNDEVFGAWCTACAERRRMRERQVDFRYSALRVVVSVYI